MSPALLLTVGLPRSGKSTWAMATGVPVVNPDSIRLALHGQAFFGPAEPMVWAVAHLMVQALFTAGHKTVILDATNITEHRRSDWRSKEWNVGFVCFKTSEEECLRRAVALGQTDLLPVIARMAKAIEWPEDNTHEARFTMNGHRFLHYVADEKP